MINANELRIGNFIGDKQRPYFPITLDNIKYFHTFLPIPITPEILEKCGFKKNRNNEMAIEINNISGHLELNEGGCNYFYPSFTQTPQGGEERTVYFNRIQSLHQLQNLYFALTGEELTITF